MSWPLTLPHLHLALMEEVTEVNTCSWFMYTLDQDLVQISLCISLLIYTKQPPHVCLDIQ